MNCCLINCQRIFITILVASFFWFVQCKANSRCWDMSFRLWGMCNGFDLLNWGLCCISILSWRSGCPQCIHCNMKIYILGIHNVCTFGNYHRREIINCVRIIIWSTVSLVNQENMRADMQSDVTLWIWCYWNCLKLIVFHHLNFLFISESVDVSNYYYYTIYKYLYFYRHFAKHYYR